MLLHSVSKYISTGKDPPRGVNKLHLRAKWHPQGGKPGFGVKNSKPKNGAERAKAPMRTQVRIKSHFAIDIKSKFNLRNKVPTSFTSARGIFGPQNGVSTREQSSLAGMAGIEHARPPSDEVGMNSLPSNLK